MHDQASRYFSSILPKAGKVRRFDVPASQALIVIDMSTWFASDWDTGRKFSIIGSVNLFVQTDSAENATASDTAETDLTGSSPTADSTQMGYIPANTKEYFELRPGMWGQRAAPEKFVHIRGSAAGAVWIAVASHETA